MGHWKKLKSASTTAALAPEEVGVDRIDKLRRLKGVAEWNFHRQRNSNSWVVEDGLTKLKRSLGLLSEGLIRLNTLANKPKKSADEELQRVEKMVRRGGALIDEINQVQLELEQSMAAEFIPLWISVKER